MTFKNFIRTTTMEVWNFCVGGTLKIISFWCLGYPVAVMQSEQICDVRTFIVALPPFKFMNNLRTLRMIH